MKRLIILVLLILSSGLYAQEMSVGDPQGFSLRNGDLLFQEVGASSFTQAIEQSTQSIDRYNFSHVGIYYSENGAGYVLEAIPYGVSKTPLEAFLKKSKKADGHPVVVVGRVKKQYQKYIPAAIERAKSLVGKRYDVEFNPTNDMYYCSELVYVAFLNRRGKPIFESMPMSFRDKSTGEPSEYWVKHFERLKKPIPEGVQGTNPGDMSKSEKIEIINSF